MSIIVSLLSAYTLSVALSCTGMMLVVFSMKHELKKIGYKIDFDRLNNCDGLDFKEFRNHLSLTPFVPFHNLIETAYYIDTFLNHRDYIYFFLNDVKALQVIEKGPDKEIDKNEKELVEALQKLEILFEETIKAKGYLSDDDYNLMMSTIIQLKRKNDDDYLLERMNKFEHKLTNNYKNEIQLNTVQSQITNEDKKEHQKVLKNRKLK